MDHSPQLKSEEVRALCQAVCLLQSEEECYRFFEDICTISEIKSIAQRLSVARMLDGEATYQEISKATGASTATISRVNRCLQYGSGGYRLVLDRLMKQGEKAQGGEE